MPAFAARSRPAAAQGLSAFFPVDAQADERPDGAAEFDGFLLGEVA